VTVNALQAEDEGREAFLNLAGEDGEIDAYELQNILNQVFIQGMAVICYLLLFVNVGTTVNRIFSRASRQAFLLLDVSCTMNFTRFPIDTRA